MSQLCLSPRDYRDVPWKNGGGTTRELFKLPHPRDADGFLLRLSIATVAESGPFSNFPGIDRTLLLLEGAGMVLTVDGQSTRLDEPLAPFTFPGEAKTDCELVAGPVRDFNVMTARGLARATVERLELSPGEVRTWPAGNWQLLYGVRGQALGNGVVLNPEHTLVWRSGSELRLEAGEQAVTAVRIDLCLSLPEAL